MPCQLSEQDIQNITIEFFTFVFPASKISPATKLAADLGLSQLGKRSLYYPLWKTFKERGCSTDVSESDFADKKTVGGIIELFAEEIVG